MTAERFSLTSGEGVIISPAGSGSKIVMFIPLQNARICLDCDTVFEEGRCPRCSSESFFPLSRWVRPAVANEPVLLAKKVKKVSLLLVASGIAYAAWHFLKDPDKKGPG